MTRRAWVAWALCGVTTALAVVHTWLFWGWSGARDSPTGWPVLLVGTVATAVLGALIVTRRPGHRIGWLFVVVAVFGALGNVLAAYNNIVTSDPDAQATPVWQVLAWLFVLLDVPVPVVFLVLIFLLFPDGQLPSHRWRWLLLATLASAAAFVLVLAVGAPPWSLDPGEQEAVPGEGNLRFLGLVILALVVELLAAATSSMLRLRRAQGVERQQLRWLAVSAALVAIGFLSAAILPFEEGLGNWLRVLPLHLAYVGVVVGAGLAVLRYRLYDLDIVVSRALLLTLATAAVAAGYVVVVVLIGAVAPEPVTDAFWPSLLAMALVALAFQPVRSRFVRLSDRVVFGSRAAPYEALAALGRNLATAPGRTDLLQHVAAAVADATGASQVTAVLELPDGSEVHSTLDRGPAVKTAAPATELAIVDRGERLGRTTLVMPPGQPLRDKERAVAERLLTQTALALRNLRLESELAARVTELHRQTAALAHSRLDLVLARDEAKARFAAALRRRVLPHLTPIPDGLRRLADRVEDGDRGDTVDAPELVAAQAGASEALDELRRLVRGLDRDSGPTGDGQRAAASQAAVSRSGPNADLVT